MRKYRENASVPDRVAYGVELVEGLRFFPETTYLAEPFETQTLELEKLYADRLQKERDMLPLRAKVKYANFGFDSMVRTCSKTAEIADGGKRGSLHSALFPNGLGSVVTPAGKAQIPVAEAFLRQLEESKASGADKLRAEWLTKLKEQLAELVAAVAARDKGYLARAEALSREDAAAEDHELALERIMGQVRSIFPKDRDRWIVIFPRAKGASGGTDEPEEPSEPARPSVPTKPA